MGAVFPAGRRERMRIRQRPGRGRSRALAAHHREDEERGKSEHDRDHAFLKSGKLWHRQIPDWDPPSKCGPAPYRKPLARKTGLLAVFSG